MANALSNLQLDSVAAADTLDFSAAKQFRLLTADGLEVLAELIEVEEQDWLRLSASRYSLEAAENAQDVADEKPVDVHQLAAGLGVGAHHRVLNHRVLLAQLGFGRVVEVMAEGPREVVHGDQVVDAGFGVVAEAVVHGGHVAEQRVAAGGWHRHGVQHRTQRRFCARQVTSECQPFS